MNERFYQAFGILTAAFSSMEADVRSLICGIAFGGNGVIASAFMDSSQLSENLNLLKKLSRQYWDKEELFLNIIKPIESIRFIRNIFIHGLWASSNFGEPNGYASVTDLKTKYKKNEKMRTWTHSLTLKYSITDFQKILDDVNLVKQKIRELCELFESEDDDINFGMTGLTASMEPILIPLNSNIQHS